MPPGRLQREAAEDLKHTRFRAQFEHGEPVDTPGLRHQANIYVRQPAG